MSSEPMLGEYVIGVTGLALLRLAFTGDAQSRAARAAEIRDLAGRLTGEARLRAPIGTEHDLQSGRLIISDVHPFLVSLGWQAQFPAGNEQKGFMRLHCHALSEYINAADSAGLRLRSLQEPPLTATAAVTPAADIVPEASRAAFAGLPAVSVWDFELTA